MYVKLWVSYAGSVRAVMSFEQDVDFKSNKPFKKKTLQEIKKKSKEKEKKKSNLELFKEELKR